MQKRADADDAARSLIPRRKDAQDNGVDAFEMPEDRHVSFTFARLSSEAR